MSAVVPGNPSASKELYGRFLGRITQNLSRFLKNNCAGGLTKKPADLLGGMRARVRFRVVCDSLPKRSPVARRPAKILVELLLGGISFRLPLGPTRKFRQCAFSRCSCRPLHQATGSQFFESRGLVFDGAPGFDKLHMLVLLGHRSLRGLPRALRGSRRADAFFIAFVGLLLKCGRK